MADLVRSRCSKVLIVVDEDSDEQDQGVKGWGRLVREKMVLALKEAIAIDSVASVTVLTVLELPDMLSLPGQASKLLTGEIICCPLTWIPETIPFPGQDIFTKCASVSLLRQWVKPELGYATGEDDYGSNQVGNQRQINNREFWANPGGLGNLYLPVVLTAKGPLYGEVIATGKNPASYEQPVDLPDQQRQPLYHLAYELLQFLAAPPAVYLVQFRFQGRDIVFERILPFPAAPAIASLGVQKPNLFTCHWYCLTGQPIVDISIIPSGTYSSSLSRNYSTSDLKSS